MNNRIFQRKSYFILLLLFIVVIYSLASFNISYGAEIETQIGSSINSYNNFNFNNTSFNSTNEESKQSNVNGELKNSFINNIQNPKIISLSDIGFSKNRSESENLILEISHGSYMPNYVIMCGSASPTYFIKVSLYYKNGSEIIPLPNKIIYLFYENEKTSVLTDENGKGELIFSPKVGVMNFKALFNESELLIANETIRDLEPISVSLDYYTAPPIYRINWSEMIILHVPIQSNSKIFTEVLGVSIDYMSNISPNKTYLLDDNLSDNVLNKNFAFSEMEKTGIPVIHLLLLLIAILFVLPLKRTF